MIFIIFFPFLGTFVYLIARGKGMGERDMAIYEASRRRSRPTCRTSRVGHERRRRAGQAGRPQGRGVITDAEFEAQKAKALG